MTASMTMPHRDGGLIRSLIRTLIAARDLTQHYPEALLALAFRLAVAMVFWRSGMTKLANWDITVSLFDMEYMLPILPPAFAAYMATTVELGCSVLLFLGLGTRFAAAALLGLTAVIQLLVYPENWPDHILWASILAYLLTRGGGLLSLDHVIGRRFSSGRAA